MSKETFKEFARNHPELATSVMKGDTSWQKLYELYDIYGETGDVWNNYLTRSSVVEQASTFQPSTFRDFFNTFKNIDLDSVQKGVTNLQKTVGLLQDIGLGRSSNSSPSTQNYEPRPMYKYFED